MTRASLLASSLAASLSLAAHAADSFIFSFNPQASSLQLAPNFSILTDGVLIGNYDAASNPTGTQTRPGLFGGSGNNPIPAAIDLALAGSDTTRPQGRFRFDADPDAGLFSIAALDADLLGGASLDTPLTLGLLYQTFRSIAPNSLYLGGVRLPLPLGNASISALAFQQTDPVPGVLVPTAEPGVSTFAALVPVTLTISASALTQTFDLPGVPAALPITGTLDARTSPPRITITWDLSVEQDIPPDVIAQIPPLENQPLDLPTILPPGNTAHLLMSLTVGSIHTALATTANLVAIGIPHCASDLNNDGIVDWFDYLDYVTAFETAAPAADFNSDGFIDFFDYSDFVADFNNPCNS